WPMVVVGAGHLGRALVHYGGFIDRGFRVIAVFDNDAAVVGTDLNQLTVMDISQMSDVIRANSVRIAMLAVPADHAQAVCDVLVASGVRAILSYAPITLIAPSHVNIQYIDPVTHLQKMTYYID
ncbi:MAG TPA: redox-sensing transcriptional repressor Rex, partial [Aggregatilineales bacterium]|nr:redox-sensing transcriptional repressor Rex [Aggregatilineales bacterium]